MLNTCAMRLKRATSVEGAIRLSVQHVFHVQRVWQTPHTNRCSPSWGCFTQPLLKVRPPMSAGLQCLFLIKPPMSPKNLQCRGLQCLNLQCHSTENVSVFFCDNVGKGFGWIDLNYLFQQELLLYISTSKQVLCILFTGPNCWVAMCAAPFTLIFLVFLFLVIFYVTLLHMVSLVACGWLIQFLHNVYRCVCVPLRSRIHRVIKEKGGKSGRITYKISNSVFIQF